MTTTEINNLNWVNLPNKLKAFFKSILTSLTSLGSRVTELEDNSGGATPLNFIPLTGTEAGNPVTGGIMMSYIDDGYNYGELTLDVSSDTIAIIKTDNGSRYDVASSTQNYIGTKAGGFVQMQDGVLRTIDITSTGLSDTLTMNPSSGSDYTQKHYVDKANSYSTDETLTGGTWIDGKPIYKIVKLMTDSDPINIDTRFPDIIVGLYSILEYTKKTD